MTLHRRFPAFSRVVRPLVLAILAAAIAATVTACEQNHYDMYLGTDAGADFDAPPREAGADDATSDAGDATGGAGGADGALAR